MIGKYFIKNISNIFKSINFIYKLSLTGIVVYIVSYYINNGKIILPKLQNIWQSSNYYIVWIIYIWHPAKPSSFIKFTIKTWKEVSLVV